MHGHFFIRGSAVSQIKVDEGLVRDTSLFRELLKITDRISVHANSNWALEFAGVRIFFRF